MKILAKIIFINSLSLVLFSCNDCLNVEIEKAEWVTRREDYRKDTLVSYSVKDAVRLTEYSSGSNRDSHTHDVTIRNNNTRYSNRYAVQFFCKYNYDTPNSWIHTTDYVEIGPNSEYTFSYNWYGARGTYDSDFSVKIEILQEPEKIILIRRIDELILSKITINTCEKSAEAEQAKYNAIKEYYLQKVNKSKQIIINK
ncbi:MAG: hypothetical protein HXX16_18305 [Bacteroidales bacterium]|nr:hypothetical protein [Bacteroidales bacterium]